ncbi:hypothetical protein V2P53_03305 [Mycoplasma capricolum subsp. capricolum]|uniref:hypothetical protein n=1 Tax=Mycoplasma capricolum TaxID=2095 RepID=UPI003DA66CFA
MIKKLNVNNNEQETLFNNLKNNSTSCYIFGLPGVGKTYFVNNLVNQMKLEFHNNKDVNNLVNQMKKNWIIGCRIY